MNETETHTDKGCEINGCQKPRKARRLCGMHLQRQYRHGSPLALLKGQDWAEPKPCRVCGGVIAPTSGRPAPVICSAVCHGVAYRRRRMADLRSRVLAGLSL
jgi:hypothetical protein